MVMVETYYKSPREKEGAIESLTCPIKWIECTCTNYKERPQLAESSSKNYIWQGPKLNA